MLLRVEPNLYQIITLSTLSIKLTNLTHVTAELIDHKVLRGEVVKVNRSQLSVRIVFRVQF